ncbi:MAG: amino acid permease [Deltaproteobacteria bacterium]|nr:amino acid permease [Deltaproteobacteria bacterium]
MKKVLNVDNKAFGLSSAIFLGIGSMVGAGIFIVIGEAGAIAGTLVTLSFILGGIIALLCGYSLGKLAVRYPSRGGIIEYLVQGYGEGLFSGTLGVLFYFAQLIALAAVAKSFGTYAATYISSGDTALYTDIFSLGILLMFVIINLVGASTVARSESIIVIIKLAMLGLFTGSALIFIHPANFSLSNIPGPMTTLYALGLTFFAYQGFSVITNSVEDMKDPGRTMMRSMVWAILIVGALYLLVTIAVFGNLPLAEVIKDRDFALAKAAEPAFGTWGFKVMAGTALLATASAINATLYAVTQIGYTLAKEGDLPEIYEMHVFHNTEGLIVSALLIVPMILLLNLGQIAATAAVAVLLIQGFTHIGHLRRLSQTRANATLIIMAVLGTFGAAFFAVFHIAESDPWFPVYIAAAFLAAFLLEVLLRTLTHRTIGRKIVQDLEKVASEIDKEIEHIIRPND